MASGRNRSNREARQSKPASGGSLDLVISGEPVLSEETSSRRLRTAVTDPGKDEPGVRSLKVDRSSTWRSSGEQDLEVDIVLWSGRCCPRHSGRTRVSPNRREVRPGLGADSEGQTGVLRRGGRQSASFRPCRGPPRSSDGAWTCRPSRSCSALTVPAGTNRPKSCFRERVFHVACQGGRFGRDQLSLPGQPLAIDSTYWIILDRWRRTGAPRARPAPSRKDRGPLLSIALLMLFLRTLPELAVLLKVSAMLVRTGDGHRLDQGFGYLPRGSLMRVLIESGSSVFCSV